MKRRKLEPEQKLIVHESLKGRPVGELWADHEISQAQYYQWRDQFLADAARAFEPTGAPNASTHLHKSVIRGVRALGKTRAWRQRQGVAVGL